MLRGAALSGVLLEIVNNPLTLADDTVYCNTNLGAVAALHAHDGRIKWLARYRRSGRGEGGLDEDDRHWFRDQYPGACSTATW